MSVCERFAARIDTCTAECIERNKSAEERGYCSDEDLKFFDTRRSCLESFLLAYVLAAQHEGARTKMAYWDPPRSGNRKGLYISNSGQRPAIYVYGIIGFHGISAEDFQSQLAKFSPYEELEVRVNSPGGSFRDGRAIHNLIADRPGPTFGFVDGHAASAGSLILMPCKHITMAAASELMLHYASMEVEGSHNAAELAKALELITETNRQLLQMYLPRWRGTEAELNAALERETYFSPRQAVAAGLADEVSESRALAAFEKPARRYGDKASYSIAVLEGERKQFRLRNGEFTLWRMIADDMREECNESSPRS